MAAFYIHQDTDKENPRIIRKEAKEANGAFKDKETHRNGGNIKSAFREVTNVTEQAENANNNGKSFGIQQDQVKCLNKLNENDKENDSALVCAQIANKNVAAVCKEYGETGEDYALDTTPMSISEVLSPMSVDCSQIINVDSIGSKQTTGNKNASSRKAFMRRDRDYFFEVVEYRESILEYFRECERKNRPKANYMRRQTDINDSMRTILIDWLVEVSEEYNLDTETLYLSVSYIDRFLSHMSVVRGKLQLVGTAAMFIAAKYEEIYPPDVSDFVFITDDTYTKAQVLRMEQIILKILTFDLCTPTAYVYMNLYAAMCEIPNKLKYLAYYISELTLLEADPYLNFYPSLISAASLALARFLLGYPIWTSEMEKIAKYRLEDMKEILQLLSQTHKSASTNTQRAINEKYNAKKYEEVSSIASVELPEDIFVSK